VRSEEGQELMPVERGEKVEDWEERRRGLQKRSHSYEVGMN
jgi:hypothetical protein